MDFGFPPIESPRARVLILGSLPGQLSLQQRQYYAQPRNAFWRIMGTLFGAGPELNYAERIEQLTRSNVAVWDVCACAQRPGSLDSAIVSATAQPNEFAEFFREHGALQLVAFNGAKAAQLYARKVSPSLTAELRGIRTITLPSTSPAHAALSYERKLAEWSNALAGPD